MYKKLCVNKDWKRTISSFFPGLAFVSAFLRRMKKCKDRKSQWEKWSRYELIRERTKKPICEKIDVVRNSGVTKVLCYVAGGVGRKRKHVGDTGQVVKQGPGRFSCSLCGSVYRHLASLTQHLEVHRNQTTCILCHTTLSRRTDLRRHMRLKHNMQWQNTIQKQWSQTQELNS